MINNMFCFQCQEAARGSGCTVRGTCGKTPALAAVLDLLVFTAKGVSLMAEAARGRLPESAEADTYVVDALFMSITNANWDEPRTLAMVRRGVALRDRLRAALESAGHEFARPLPRAARFSAGTDAELRDLARTVGVLATGDADVRSLRELLVYGLKGAAAYLEHARNLGHADPGVIAFLHRGLAATLDDSLGFDAMLALVLECGAHGVTAMALLDGANTSAYGHPEISTVQLGVRGNPAILVSGHDLRDLAELLEQTAGTGVDVYTHGEMLPAHYYPAFKRHPHFVGNYGDAWWRQERDFEAFNGPVLLTTNCLVPPLDSYADRIYTTGAVGFGGCPHVPEREADRPKDFSALIAHAKRLPAPTALESGTITGGFAHHQVMALAGPVLEAVRSGAIRKFVVMAGCDGRMKSRSYYTDFANGLPRDTVILTAGCAKYRYNKLPLGDIGGIPRVLDAGQCNDSYSLAVIALKLKEALGLKDINELPIVYNIAWYEQKAVIVLLALLHLGVRNIRLGPTLPAFLSPNVATLLVKTFGLGGIGEVDEDLATLVGEGSREAV